MLGAPFFVAGDVRANEHVAPTIMHTIWLREHNRIVRELAEINPCWDDERLYQEGRKIVEAIMQVITYKEFLPVLLGNRRFNIFVRSYLLILTRIIIIIIHCLMVHLT